MVNFRKTLMVVALLALCAGLASAQINGNCNFFNPGNQLRGEGVAEALGAITVYCTNDVLLSPNVVGTYTITVSVANNAANFTSEVDSTVAANNEVYFVGGNNTVTPGVTSSNGSTITWTGVSPSFTNTSGSNNGVIIGSMNFVVYGLRVNASLVNGTTVGLAFTAVPTPGQTNPTAPSLLFGGSNIYVATPVATVAPSMTFSANTVSLTQCSGSGGTINLVFAENKGFPNAFTTLAQEQANDPVNPTLYATQGTRLTATFTNIPANVVLTVPNTITNGTLTIAIVTGAAADGTGGTVATTSGTTTLKVVAGTTTVTYEVTGDVLNSVETATIPVTVTPNGIPGLTSTASPVTVTGQYAPLSTNPGPSLVGGSPIPRFYTANPGNANALKVLACSTNLLFPFLTNSAGWSTSIAISNTASDPFGTTGSSGNCSISFYGAAGAPAKAVVFGADRKSVV